VGISRAWVPSHEFADSQYEFVDSAFDLTAVQPQFGNVLSELLYLAGVLLDLILLNDLGDEQLFVILTELLVIGNEEFQRFFNAAYASFTVTVAGHIA
jgi:hypothetical protein